MEKSINITIEETKQKIASAVEESKLPVSVLDMLLKDLYMEIHGLAIDVTNKELKEYYKDLSI